MIKNKVFWFPILFFLLTVGLASPAMAFFYDEEEDIYEEEADSKSKKQAAPKGSDGKAERKREDQLKLKEQKKEQLQKWISQLKSLKYTQKEAAIVSLTTKILNHSTDNLEALSALGAFYLQKGRLQLAKIIFTRALKKHPEQAVLHSNLGIIALKADKRQEAIQSFKKSLKYQYSNYVAAAHLGNLYLQAYEYEYALEYLNIAYDKGKADRSISHPEIVKIGNNYAVALAWSGDFKKAEDIFQDLIKSNVNKTEIFLNYALLLGINLGEKKTAFKILNKADLMDTSQKYARKIRALKDYLKSSPKTKGQKNHKKHFFFVQI